MIYTIKYITSENSAQSVSGATEFLPRSHRSLDAARKTAILANRANAMRAEIYDSQGLVLRVSQAGEWSAP